MNQANNSPTAGTCHGQQTGGESGTTSISSWQKARFSAAISGYRIFRLSLELFLVEHVLANEYRVAAAGMLFLIYSVADFVTGLCFLWVPTICFGSKLRALGFFCLSVGTMSSGFIGLFLSTDFRSMALCASLCGYGTAMWFVNYQTLTNTFFIKLDQIARIRQAFECIGFLLPSICLAIVNSVSANTGSVTAYSAAILGATGIGFYLFSADMVFLSASRIDRDTIARQEETVIQTVKSFFKSSVFKYFALDSILLAAANLAFGTMSVVTEQYFGLKPTFLWIAAIGFPIGGTISVIIALKVGSDRDSKTRVLSGCASMAVVFCAMIGVSPAIVEGPAHREKAAKAGLFIYGLLLGGLYSDTFSSAFALWLDKLKDFTPGFVARSNVFHNAGVQAIVAGIFQAQTILIDFTKSKGASITVQALVFFGPLIVLVTAAFIVVKRIAYPKDAKFGWPFSPPYPWGYKVVFRAIKIFMPNHYEGFLFGRFCDWRTSYFGFHLENSIIQKGPKAADTSRLVPSDLQAYLQVFDELGTDEQYWEVKGTLCNVLLKNDVAFEKRIELIRRAESNIWLVTWSLDGNIGNQIADELIKQHRKGVRVHVMLDAVNLRFLEAKRELDQETSVCREIALRLLEAGIEIKMLSTLYEEKVPAYLIGNHRKILLIDDRWMLTGGRNTDDSYSLMEENRGFSFHDADIALEGPFTESTVELLQKLWNGGRSINHALRDDAKNGKAVHHDDSVALQSIDVNEEQNSGERETRFFRQVSNRSSRNLGSDVTIFQLDHKAGRIDGHDITLSTLLFLIETAETSIDLVFGYFQLFEPVERAIAGAVSRGVKVRLVTNSTSTNDLFFFNSLFRKAFMSLLNIGVDIYVPASSDKTWNEGELCLHFKMALIDSRVLMLGSWNSTATSVFYDSEFTTVLFAELDTSGVFESVEQFIEESIDCGRFVQTETCPEEQKMPLVARLWLLQTKSGTRQVERGF